MKKYFKELAKLSTSEKATPRIRFMILDLIEMRECGWKARRETEKAKTIDELHDDIAREEGKKPKKKPDAAKAAADGNGGPSADGWETVAVGKKGKPAGGGAGGAGARGGDEKSRPAPVSGASGGAFSAFEA